jgi:glycosyltransferase involved in cell wall biosynthesis
VRNLNILHVVPSFYPAHFYGGPIQSVYALCRRLSDLGCRVRVLTTDANGPKAVLDLEKSRELELEDGVRIRYCRRLMPESVSRDLLACLPTYIRWADVIHLTGVYSFPTMPALIAARMLGKPVIWSPRGSLLRWDGRRKHRLKLFWEAACRIASPPKLLFHVTSETELADARAKFPTHDAAVVLNGVEVPATRKRSWRKGKLRIVYMGRLDPIKAIENLVLACEQLNPAHTSREEVLDWSLTIAGGGDHTYAVKLRRLIEKVGLSDRIEMPGEVLDAARERIFESADIVVLPSHSENFGMVLAEALARGIPVIASKGTPWRRLEEVGCGLWVDASPSSLANAIRRISLLPLEEMGARGRAWMRDEFSWRSRAQEMIQLYERVLGN